jgi:hypothetical protein
MTSDLGALGGDDILPEGNSETMIGRPLPGVTSGPSHSRHSSTALLTEYCKCAWGQKAALTRWITFL